jgi:hypothetical protein
VYTTKHIIQCNAANKIEGYWHFGTNNADMLAAKKDIGRVGHSLIKSQWGQEKKKSRCQSQP